MYVGSTTTTQNRMSELAKEVVDEKFEVENIEVRRSFLKARDKFRKGSGVWIFFCRHVLRAVFGQVW